MIIHLTKLYEGDDLSGATANVIYLPITFSSVLIAALVKTDVSVSGDVVLAVKLNGSSVGTVTVSSGQKVGTLTGLEQALAVGDEIVLEVVSGNISAPLTLDLALATVVPLSTSDVYDAVKAILLDGSNVTITEDDEAKTLTIASTGGGGGSGPALQTVTYTTASLANNAQETGTVTMGKTFILVKVTADKQARVRVYSSSAYRTADAARIIGTAPTGEHGVILDAYIQTGNLNLDLMPAPVGTNAEGTRTANIPVAIQNKSGSTGTVEVVFSYLVLET